MVFLQQNLFEHNDPTPAVSGQADASSVRLVRVAFPDAGDRLYDYGLPANLDAGQLQPGRRVRVPFGKNNQLREAFCIEFPTTADVGRVKFVEEIVDEPLLINAQLMELAKWISGYYCCPLGAVLTAMVPSAVRKQIGVKRVAYVRLADKDRTHIKLGPKGRAVIEFFLQQPADQDPWLPIHQVQQAATCTPEVIRRLVSAGWLEITLREQIHSPSVSRQLLDQPIERHELNEHQQRSWSTAKAIIDQGGFNAMLLFGVTGSGKTEVYLRCIEHVVAAGRQAMVMVPEIAMTPQIISRFCHRFRNVAVLHSGMSASQRNYHWRWIAEGHADVVVGARSAVFAPLDRLGLIVVDEEHEPSYKQDSVPRYHGRDVAVKRAQLAGVPVILGSATPSLETWHNAQTRGHYTLIELPQRVRELPMPAVRIVDMAQERADDRGWGLLSAMLEERLRACLARKRQAILLLNRRGHSHFIYCPSCRYTLNCPNCDVSLTYHQPAAKFEKSQRCWVMCHHCLHTSEVNKRCPVCSKNMILIGPGTQRAETELQKRFPDAKIQRVDSDAIKPADFAGVLSDFAAGRVDILLGTQMVGKGLDFPGVDVVGVLNADISLSMPDFRSSERTYQIISQVVGRCGRSGDSGQAVVQSYLPSEAAIQFAAKHAYREFASRELAIRKQCHMPPFSRLARIILRDQKVEKVEEESKILRAKIDELIAGQEGVQVMGPMPATIARLEGYYRYQILIRTADSQAAQRLLAGIREMIFGQLRVAAVVDVDPMNLL